MTGRISRELAGVDSDLDAGELLSTPEDIKALEPGLRAAVEEAVAVASHAVFVAAVPVMAVFVIAVWFLPELELRTTTALAAHKPADSPGG